MLQPLGFGCPVPLPPGVTNGPETTATFYYGVRPRSWVTLTLVAGTLLLGYLVYGRRLRSVSAGLAASPRFRMLAERLIAILIKTFYVILFGLVGAGLIGSAIYLASSLYALTTEWALPTTALIRWSPIAEWAASNEPYFAYLLLMLAGLGALTTWLLGLNPTLQKLIEPYERLLYRLLFWGGYPIAACALVLCLSAMMVGIVRPNDPANANIAGLVPFNDAFAHLTSSYDQMRDGTWISFALRRPLAAAFRSNLLVFGNFSLQAMLILQACLLAAAACFAAWSVAIWRGIWAAIAFFALTYIYARVFSPTTLTEPLGLIWALLSVPFFIEFFRSGSIRSAQVAFAMTAVELMTRMGSMMTIPALLLWLVLQFGRDRAANSGSVSLQFASCWAFLR